MSENNIVHVAVAVIRNSEGQYLIAKRAQNSHQGGLWEFPGGKVENNESVVDALKRELFEEIGISLSCITPLIKIHHNYDDKSVLLDVFQSDNFSGKEFGKEGQEIRWIKLDSFHLYDFPIANQSIIKAILLPDKYMITGKFNDEDVLLTKIQSAIKNGIRLIQFRAHHLSEECYFDYAKKIFSICRKQNIKLLLNTSIKQYEKNKANKFSNGIHLISQELRLLSSGSLIDDLMVSASVHNKEELYLAEKKYLDFVVLSPVNKTLSHPDSIPLGWDEFELLTEKASIPVFALGGMEQDDLNIAKNKGAQGIAAISAFWKS